MELNKETVKLINKLMQLHYDAARTYRDGKYVLQGEASTDILTFFQQQERIHEETVEKLREEFKKHHINAEQTAHFFDDTFSSMATELMTVFSGQDTYLILNKCLQAEQNFIDDYQKGLKIKNLPPSTQQLLNNQLSVIQKSIKWLESKVHNKQHHTS